MLGLGLKFTAGPVLTGCAISLYVREVEIMDRPQQTSTLHSGVFARYARPTPQARKRRLECACAVWAGVLSEFMRLRYMLDGC